MPSLLPRIAAPGLIGTLGWMVFFGLILLAWLGLFAMQPNVNEAELVTLYGSSLWASLCAPLTGQSTLFEIFLMWALMSAAMMAPSFAPTLKTYRDLTYTEAANLVTTVALLAGYITVWLGFSIVAAAVQLDLARLGLLGVDGVSINWALTSGLLFVAGFYQFSRMKDACLSKCRAPFTYFMGNWRPGVVGAASMGFHLGLTCLGCCWALMSLGFVGGVVNLVWMGVATALMVVEKLPQIGRFVTRPLGVLLLAGGVFAGLNAFGF